MRIIFGTDFSSTAFQAGNVAAAIAVRLGATLQATHVSAKRDLSPEVVAVLDSRIAEDLEIEAERLRRLGATVRTNLLHGSPAEELAALSRAPGARMVVVASKRTSCAERWLVGSVSEAVAESAGTPTLVVLDPNPIEAWARDQKPLKVFVAMDMTLSAEAALLAVRELQQIGPCEVTVGHANWSLENLRSALAEQSVESTDLAQSQATVARDLEAKAAAILGKGVARVVVAPRFGRAETAIVEMARDANADLIVTGTHQRRGLERLAAPSVSRGLLHSAPISVLCVPVKDVVANLRKQPQEIRRVLAATDFSAAGDEAVACAWAATPAGGTLKLIHVLPPWRLPSPLVPHYTPDRVVRKKHKQLAAQALQKLRALISSIGKTAGITTEIEIVESEKAAAGICQEAERFGADLICVGTHGRTGVTGALLGSVSQGVIANSNRPVLTVPARPL